MSEFHRRGDESEGRRGSRSHVEEGGRYLGIPPGTLRDPHQQHPWYPRGCSADIRSEPEQRVSSPLNRRVYGTGAGSTRHRSSTSNDSSFPV